MPKKNLITDKIVLNRILYWLNFQPSIYNPTVRTIVRNGALFGIELTTPKEKLEFINETNNTLLYYYYNNNLNNLPASPKETIAKNLKTVQLFDLDTIDSSNNRYSQPVTFKTPQKPLRFNLKNNNNFISNEIEPRITIGQIVIDNTLETTCDCETCYGICCRPSGVHETRITITGNITNELIECDDEFSIYYHKLNNAIDAISEMDIMSWLKDNGWINVNLNETTAQINCVSDASYNVTATCYGDLDYDNPYNMIPLSSGQAEISWNSGLLYACNNNSEYRIFDEDLTQNECENIGGNWLQYCASDNCEIQAITNIALDNSGIYFDVSNVILPTGSKDLNIISILSDIDLTTKPNKIGFNVGVGNFEPTSTGNIIIPITGCDINYSSEYVQFSPAPSEIMIITNVALNTSDNPGLVFDVISVTGTINSTQQKIIPISSCN